MRAIYSKVKWALRLPGAGIAVARDRALSRRGFPVELAVGAIFKDEARYLEEWLTFHQQRGVERFFLYNNRSTDDFAGVLAPWIERGVVTLTDWPQLAGQLDAYRDCIRRFRGETRWLTFFDIDEFLYSPVESDLRVVLRRFADVPAVFVYCHMFGSGGHVTAPPGSVLRAYTRRSGASNPRTGKSILNPRLVRDVPNPHFMKLWVGAAVDERRLPPPFYFPPPPGHFNSCSLLRINHYWSKSIDDLHAKVRRGNASLDEPRVLADHLLWESSLNATEDRDILRLVAG